MPQPVFDLPPGTYTRTERTDTPPVLAAATASAASDSFAAIASDLDQLADEVAGNESRPSAEDICARVKQAANRLRNAGTGIPTAPPHVQALNEQYQTALYEGEPVELSVVEPDPANEL